MLKHKKNKVSDLKGGCAVVLFTLLASNFNVAQADDEYINQPVQSFSPTLVQLQQTAITRSPDLAIQVAEKDIALANVELAEDAWLPSVSANISKSYGRGTGSFLDTNVSNRKVSESGKVGFNITQKLYDPLAQINIAQADLNAQAVDYATTQQYIELTNRVVSLFFDILATQAEIQLLEGQQVAVAEQQKQAQLSFDVGTVSITDVREAQAKNDRIKAQKSALTWQMQSKQSELAILTGMTIQPQDYLASTKALPDIEANDIDTWLMMFSEQNHQLKQAIIDYQLAELETDKLSYQHYPTVQLVVENNRYLEPWSDKARPNYSNNKWDWSAGVQVEFNLFDPSVSSAQSKKTVATEAQKLANIRQAQERLSIELQSTFYQTLASIAEYQGLYQAKESAKTSLLANMLGYEVGMRINADVLDAQSKVYEVNRDQLIAWYDSWRNYIKLNQLAGTLTVDQLAQIDDTLRQSVPDRAEIDMDMAGAQ